MQKHDSPLRTPMPLQSTANISKCKAVITPVLHEINVHVRTYDVQLLACRLPLCDIVQAWFSFLTCPTVVGETFGLEWNDNETAASDLHSSL